MRDMMLFSLKNSLSWPRVQYNNSYYWAETCIRAAWAATTRGCTRISQYWLMRREATCVEQTFYRCGSLLFKWNGTFTPPTTSRQDASISRHRKKEKSFPRQLYIRKFRSFDRIRGVRIRGVALWLSHQKPRLPQLWALFWGKGLKLTNSTSKLIISKLPQQKNKVYCMYVLSHVTQDLNRSSTSTPSSNSSGVCLTSVCLHHLRPNRYTTDICLSTSIRDASAVVPEVPTS